MTTLMKFLSGSVIAGTLAASLAAMPTLASAHDDATPVYTPYGTSAAVSLASDGSVLVRGAHITNVSGDEITAQTSWGATTMTWQVHTSSSTDEVDSTSASTTLGNMKDGDIVSFSGSLDTTASSLTVNADTVRDWSLNSAPKPAPMRPMVVRLWDSINLHFPSFNFFGHVQGNDQ